jgi:hypothetical protein
MAVAVCAGMGALVFRAALRHPERPVAGSEESMARYPLLWAFSDAEEFREHLRAAAEGIAQGRVVFPVSDYDCPVGFLLPMGALVAATGADLTTVMTGFAVGTNILAGLTAFGFMRALGVRVGLALAAGVGYQTAPYALYFPAMGHLHCAQLQWMPLVLWAGLRVVQQGTWRTAVGLGLAMGLQVLSSPYYTLYVAYFALPVLAGVWWWKAEPPKPKLPRLVLCVGLAVAVAVGVALVYLLPRLGHLPRKYPLDANNGYHLTTLKSLWDPWHPLVFLGPAAWLGVISAVCWRAGRSVEFSATLAAATVVGLMLLPGVPGSPYWAAYHTLPMLDHTRAPVRLAPLLNLLLLAAGAQWCSRHMMWTWAFGLAVAAGAGWTLFGLHP